MRSDERVARALAAVGAQVEAFRAAVAAAHEVVRGHLTAFGALEQDRAALVRRELGGFAAGRIDVDRFAALGGGTRILPAGAEDVVRRCADVLEDVLERGDLLFTVEVPPGGDLRTCVDRALAEAGRAFGAVLAFQAVKTGVWAPEQHEPMLRAFPFARWNRAERGMGVPLVVHVGGADLRAESLAEFLDGRQRIVLVVDGPCAPAPLARLVSPSLFVQQGDDLARLAAWEGAAIVALMPAEAARFVHDPAAPTPLVVAHLPADPRASVGPWSAWQQREQVALLRRLAEPGAARERRLGEVAEWLLHEAGFAGGAT